MKDVLLRHYPELEPVVGDVERVFAPWPKLGAPERGKEEPRDSTCRLGTRLHAVG
jgi:hypothetical protein